MAVAARKSWDCSTRIFGDHLGRKAERKFRAWSVRGRRARGTSECPSQFPPSGQHAVRSLATSEQG